MGNPNATVPSRKRKQSPLSTPLNNAAANSPFSGMLTRHKSDKYFFSRNRSGKSRKCRETPPEIQPRFDGTLDNDDIGVGRVSIKDLRARRVFSKPPDNIEENPSFDIRGGNSRNPNFEMLGKCDLGKGGGMLAHVNDDSLVLSKKSDGFGVGGLNTNLLVSSEKCGLTEIEKCGDYGVDLMIGGLDCENPNLLGASTMVNGCVDARVGLMEEGLNGGNTKMPVLKKCDSRAVNGNTDLGLQGLKDGDVNQLRSSEKCDSMINSVVSDLTNGGNVEMGDLMDGVDCISGNSLVKGGVGENCSAVNEDIVLSTPPALVSLVRRSPTKQTSPPIKDGSSEWKNSNAIKQMTLNKCSKRKVFKVPNSFNYKRMLPYLMELAKDEQCAPKADPNERTMDSPKLPEMSLADCVQKEVSIDRKGEHSTDSSERRVPDDSKNGVSEDEYISLDNLVPTSHSPKTNTEASKKAVSSELPSHISVDQYGSGVNLIAEGSIALCHDSSMSSKNCADYSVDSMIEDLDGANLEIPDLSGGNDVTGNLTNKCVSGVGCGGKTLDDFSPNVTSNAGKGRAGDNCEVVNEELVQTTPPESVFVIRRADDHNVLESENSVMRSLTKQISTSKDVSTEGKRFTNSMKEMTLNKCSRRKVFKVPNSFTYKRLLPYLMGMAKDEPLGTMTANPSVKIESSVDEEPVISLSQESTIDGTKLPEKLLTTTATCIALEPSSDKNDEFSANKCQTNTVFSEKQLPDESKKGVSQVEYISPDNPAATFHIPKTSSEASNKDSSLEHPSHLSVSTDEESIAVDTEFKVEQSPICKFQSSNEFSIAVSSDAHVVGSSKGILKRNPRGCRGICSCLDCTSFRLNSQKAFEFSRNQLFEAEELAHDLMKELSNLSCMLKNSDAGATEVEEACRRASNVEDLAKSRLSQLHEDLYVHSRTKALQRPRVNFSRNVQENAAKESTKRIDHLV